MGFVPLPAVRPDSGLWPILAHCRRYLGPEPMSNSRFLSARRSDQRISKPEKILSRFFQPKLDNMKYFGTNEDKKGVRKRQSIALIPDWLRLRFWVRYNRNPVYANNRTVQNRLKAILRGLKSSVRYVQIPVYPSPVQEQLTVIDKGRIPNSGTMDILLKCWSLTVIHEYTLEALIFKRSLYLHDFLETIKRNIRLC